MADKYFLGTATAVAQVWTGSIDSVDATPSNNTFTVTIGGVAVSVAGDTDVNTTATNLRTALNDSTHPYFAAITWSGTGGDIIGTADVAGVPFVAALTETGAGSGTVTDFAATTASAGPSDWSTAANWSDGSVPANTDNVTLAKSGVNILYGLDQNGVTLGSLTVLKSFTGKLGLLSASFEQAIDASNPNTAAEEYRQDRLKIGADRIDIGLDSGIGSHAGSTRLKVDNVKSGASTCVVHATSNSTDTGGLAPFRYTAAHASADLVVRSGIVGVAADKPDETSTVGDIQVSASSAATKVVVGDGVTLTNFIQDNGTNHLQAAATVTKVEVNGGQLTTEGDFTVTTLEQNGGTTFPNHIKTSGSCITTANVNGGLVDFTRSGEARTVGTLNPDGGTIKLDDDVVTVTTWDQPSGKRQVATSEL